MRRLLVVTVLAAALGSTPLPAQAPKPGEDPLAQLLFDPQLVLKFARELSLQAAQRAAIVAAVKDAQVVDLQLEMLERHRELIEAVETPRVDEKAAMAAAGLLLGLEREMKQKQLLLLIRIKNALTREQQEQLRELRKATEKTGGEGGESDAAEELLKRMGLRP